jgi:hypothetical protein
LPELSRFYGIVVRMFVEAGEAHHRPHFHAYFGEHAAVYAVYPIELMAGSLPRPQDRLAVAWAEIHQAELRAAWEALQSGRVPAKIEPLR